MIKDNQKVFNRLHLVVDAIVVLISYLLAWYIKFATGFADTEPGAGALSKETYFRFLYFLVPGYIAIYYYFNMYKPKRVTRRKVELINIISANTAGLVFFIVVLYVIKQPHFSRIMMFLFYGINIILTTVCRMMIKNLLQLFRRRGYNLKYILLIGYSRAARLVDAMEEKGIVGPQDGSKPRVLVMSPTTIEEKFLNKE